MKPYDPAELDGPGPVTMSAKGVYYYDLYNEPNLAGPAGGWCQEGGEPQPEVFGQNLG